MDSRMAGDGARLGLRAKAFGQAALYVPVLVAVLTFLVCEIVWHTLYHRDYGPFAAMIILAAVVLGAFPLFWLLALVLGLLGRYYAKKAEKDPLDSSLGHYWKRVCSAEIVGGLANLIVFSSLVLVDADPAVGVPLVGVVCAIALLLPPVWSLGGAYYDRIVEQTDSTSSQSDSRKSNVFLGIASGVQVLLWLWFCVKVLDLGGPSRPHHVPVLGQRKQPPPRATFAPGPVGSGSAGRGDAAVDVVVTPKEGDARSAEAQSRPESGTTNRRVPSGINVAALANGGRISAGTSHFNRQQSDPDRVLDGELLPEGERGNSGTAYWTGHSSCLSQGMNIEITFEKSRLIVAFLVQATNDSTYQIQYWDGVSWKPACDIARVEEPGLRTRLVELESPIRTGKIRIGATGGAYHCGERNIGRFAVSEVQAFSPK